MFTEEDVLNLLYVLNVVAHVVNIKQDAQGVLFVKNVVDQVVRIELVAHTIIISHVLNVEVQVDTRRHALSISSKNRAKNAVQLMGTSIGALNIDLMACVKNAVV